MGFLAVTNHPSADSASSVPFSLPLFILCFILLPFSLSLFIHCFPLLPFSPTNIVIFGCSCFSIQALFVFPPLFFTCQTDLSTGIHCVVEPVRSCALLGATKEACGTIVEVGIRDQSHFSHLLFLAHSQLHNVNQSFA